MRKINELVISSTSFLNSKSYSWDHLKNNYKVKFDEFSTWNNSLGKSKINSTVVLVIFLDDLVNDINENIKIYKIILNEILKLLQNRLNYTNENTIFLYSYNNKLNSLKISRKISVKDSISFWLLRKLNNIAKKISTFIFLI